MLILLEAVYPIPLVNALQEALSAYPNDSVTVMKDEPFIDEKPYGRTVVFMLNRDKKSIAPAIRQRCSQGYQVFALKLPTNGLFDPFYLTIQLLGLLPKIVDVLGSNERIEPGGDQFIHLIQLRNRQITKIQLRSMRPVTSSTKKKRSVSRRDKPRRQTADGELTFFK